ncbi:MAG: hypothetical protein KDC38_11980 [Planctomycetes bacterium]|nr:hypothetical protein [Planctomycetota bacterium]
MNARLLAIATVLMVGVACTTKSQDSTPMGGKGEKAAVALPESLFLSAPPTDVTSIADAKSHAKVGDTVVFKARIGGREAPFVENRAIMLVVDPEIPSCAELHGDSCPTPWDYCCEPEDNLKANTATVRFVDADGKPRKVSIENQHGLEPLVSITVIGKVAEKDDAGSLVVDATGVYMEKKG